jgi:hypothetical protein
MKCALALRFHAQGDQVNRQSCPSVIVKAIEEMAQWDLGVMG